MKFRIKQTTVVRIQLTVMIFCTVCIHNVYGQFGFLTDFGQGIVNIGNIIIDVIGRLVGIPTEDDTGIFCDPILDSVASSLISTATTDSLQDQVPEFNCGCQLVAGSIFNLSPRVLVTCESDGEYCYVDETVSPPERFCGLTTFSMDARIGVVTLAPTLGFSLANFLIDLCWDFTGDEYDYKTICFEVNTNVNFDTFTDCVITAGDEPCICTECTTDSGEDGIMADCSTVNLNNDLGAPPVFTDKTICFNPTNIDDLSIPGTGGTVSSNNVCSDTKVVETSSGTLVLNSCFRRQIEIGLKGSRTITVYYTSTNGSEEDQIDDYKDAEQVLDWIQQAWTSLESFNDPIVGTEFDVAIYDVLTWADCCNDNLLSIDAARLVLNPDYTRERVIYHFWKSINFSETHGQWINDGFSVYGAYRVLVDNVYQTTQDYKAALALYMAGEYQLSLVRQEMGSAVFWKYYEEQTFLSGTAESIPDLWSEGLTGIDVFEKAASYLNEVAFASFFADFGTACYANGFTSFDSSVNFLSTRLTFADSDRLKAAGLEPYPNLEPNYDFVINTGTFVIPMTTAEMPTWSNSYFRLSLQNDETASLQIRVIQDYDLPVTYTLLFVRQNELKGFVRQDLGNFERTIPDDGYTEIVLIITSYNEPLSFQYEFYTEDPVLQIAYPRSLTAVGDPSLQNQFLLRFKVLDSKGGKPIAGLTKADIEITVGSATVATEDIVLLDYTQDQYIILARAPAQDQSVSGSPLDLTVQVGYLVDTLISVILYEDRISSDTIVVIDRSQSMGESGILEATRAAASVLIDSYSTGDQIGVVTYGSSASVDAMLADFSVNREACLQAIANIMVAESDAFIGNALLTSLGEFDARGNYNSAASLVIISDGPSPNTDTGIESFLAAWDARTLLPCTSTDKSGCRPIVHTVNIGERVVYRPDLERLSLRTGGLYHFFERPSTSFNRRLQPNDVDSQATITVELSGILRSINDDILSTNKVLSEIGVLPCSDTQGSVDVTFNIDGSVSNLIVFFIWTGSSLQPQVQLLLPNGNAVGNPKLTADNHYLWSIDGTAKGRWTLSVSPSEQFCSGAFSFAVDVAAVADIFLETFTAFQGSLPMAGVDLEISAALRGNGLFLGQKVSTTIISPDGSSLEIDLEDRGNGLYTKSFVPTQAGNYQKFTTVSGSEIVVGDGIVDRTDESAFGVPFQVDSDSDGIVDAVERQYLCLDRNKDDADEDYDEDGLSNSQELRRGFDPCVWNTNSGAISEIVGGQNPTNPNSDVIPCSSTFTADRVSVSGGGSCRNLRQAILRYSPNKVYASINIWRADIEQGDILSRLRQNDFKLLNDERDESLFTNVDGDFIDTEVEFGKQYCYRFQGIAVDGGKSCVKGLGSKPVCVTIAEQAACVVGMMLNKGNCCTVFSKVALNIDASGVNRMKLSGEPSFENAEWEVFAASRAWDLRDDIFKKPQTVYALFEGQDGSTKSRTASITLFEPLPTFSPTEAPTSAPCTSEEYRCEAIFGQRGVMIHFDFLGLFCFDWCSGIGVLTVQISLGTGWQCGSC